jgi:hypothetical protein
VSKDLYNLCEQILFEIEAMQNRLFFALRLAKELSDEAVMADLRRTQDEINVARERLLRKMHEKQQNMG